MEDQLDTLLHNRHALNSINITNEEALKELKEYDKIWFRNIAPYIRPLKHNLIGINIKRFKLIHKLNKVSKLCNEPCIPITNRVCDICQSKLIDIAKGKIYCGKCNVNDDIIFNKKGVYSPQKHFRNWLDCIIGREEDMKGLNEVKNSIISILNNKNLDINDITIYDIRRCLKLCKAVKYNKNLTKLYKEITGKETPTLCLQTETIILKYAKLISLNVELNMKYYPYYIYKLIELFGSDEDKKILKFIYLQSNKTISKSDKSWEELCKKINIKFIPTM